MFNLEEMSRLAYIKQVTLDLADTSTKKYLTAKQNDINSRFLEIVITEELKPKTISADTAVILRGTKPNGKAFLNEGIIVNGKIYIDLSSAITHAGRAKCDINLTDSKGSISTVTFYLEITEQPFNENAVVESEEFSALNVALVKVQAVINAYKIDKEYSPTSDNAQSGKAVAAAISESVGQINSVLATLVEVEEV